jgi:uncharacterized LabA/DUF88 family protein
MAEATYTYIDGESHFLRADEAWRNEHGPTASLTKMRFKNKDNSNKIAVDPEARLFWTEFGIGYHGEVAVYFTAMSGSSDSLHEVKVRMRQLGLEPYVIPELRQLANQREQTLERAGLIEKPKGVDAALAVRMLEDAYNDNFNRCYLFTSDVDYLPVIEAVRRRGKRVCVVGFENGLGKRSPLLYVPDYFIDLWQHIKTRIEPIP